VITRILNSLSARLLGIFLVTALLYGFGAYLAVNFVLDRDDLRQMIGPQISYYVDLLLQDIGSPPDIGRAQEIVNRIPVDLRISGPGLDWASDPNFPSAELLAAGESQSPLENDHANEKDQDYRNDRYNHAAQGIKHLETLL